MSTTVAQTIADLRGAANAIRTEGWTTGDFIDNQGGLCTAGAILFAIGGETLAKCDAGTTDQWERYYAARNEVSDRLRYHECRGDVLHWNDKFCKSGDNAAQLLDTVATDIEAEAVPAS